MDDLEWKPYRAAVLEAVQTDPDLIASLALPLRDDKEIVLHALRGRATLLMVASQRLKSDRDVVMQAMLFARSDEAISVLQSASCSFRDDPDVMLLAAHLDGETLWFGTAAIKNTKEIVLAAVQNWGAALEFLDDDSPLLEDDEIITAAVGSCGDVLFSSAVKIPEIYRTSIHFQVISARAPRRRRSFRGSMEAIAAAQTSIAHKGELAPVIAIESVEQVAPAVLVRTMCGKQLEIQLDENSRRNVAALAHAAARHFGCPRVHVLTPDDEVVGPWEGERPL